MNFIEKKKGTKTKTLLTAGKISEQLLNNLDSDKNYQMKKFNALHQCFNMNDLIKLKAIAIAKYIYIYIYIYILKVL